MKTCLLFTANDPQLGASHLMTTTLRDTMRGGYQGDICVLSTSLSDSAKAYLDRLGIDYCVDDMTWAEHRIAWQRIFPDRPEREALAEFHAYRNKRMSKLIYLEWFAHHGQDYDAVAVGDNDLYFQRDVTDLFALAENGRVNYAKEDNPIFPGSNLWLKDTAYRRHTGKWSHDGGNHEVNIGFIIARSDVMAELFTEIRDRFIALPPALIRDANWHDQDLTRALRCERQDLFAEFPQDTILHLCGGGMALVEQREPGYFINRLSGNAPRIVHFGGGAWKDFPAIAPSYKVSSQIIFDDINRCPADSAKVAISKAVLDSKRGVLRANGWYVSDQAKVEILLSMDGLGVIGKPRTGISRPDVRRQYPNETLTVGGWEVALTISKAKVGQKLFATLLVGATNKTAQAQITTVA